MAEQGNEACIEIMKEVGKYLAIAISNVSVCLDPQIIIVGGGISEVGDVLFNPLNEYLRKNLKLANPSLKVVKSKLGSDAYAMGAATAVLHQIFQSPNKFVKV